MTITSNFSVKVGAGGRRKKINENLIEQCTAVKTFPTVEGRGLEGVQSNLSRAWKGCYHS